MRRIAFIVAALFACGLVRDLRAETPAEYEVLGAAALKLSQTEADAIVTAAINYGKATEAYEKGGNEAKATEMNSFLYWCKKKMTFKQMDVFLKGETGETAALAKRLKALETEVVKPNEAQAYFDRAEKYARDNPDEHLLIAIRFFEVADRFKGDELSLKAQDRSLAAMQDAFKNAAAGAKLPNPVKSEKTEDLLKRLDPDKDGIVGTWSLANGILRCTSKIENSRIRLPIHPGAEYDLHLVFARESGDTAIGPILMFKDQRARMDLGRWGNQIALLTNVGGMDRGNKTQINLSLTNGKQYDLSIQVREGSIHAVLNGEEVCNYKTADGELSYPDVLNDPQALGLSVNKATATFSTVEFTPINNDTHTVPQVAKPDIPLVRSPVPSAAQLKEAEKTIREIYKDDFAKLGAADKAALGNKLEHQAAETQGDPAGQYELLLLAANLAAQASDLELFLSICSTLSNNFVSDAKDVRKIGLGTLINVTKDPAVSKAAIAFKTLNENPADPSANLTAGRYEGLLKDNWERAIPLLAKGSKCLLKTLAEQEQAAKADPSLQATLADAWFDASEKVASDKTEMKAYQQRAAYWYRAALPGLSGLVRTKAEKRIGLAGPPSAVTAAKPAVPTTSTTVAPPPQQVPVINPASGVLTGTLLTESLTIPPGIYKLNGTYTSKGKINISIAAGTSITGGSFDLAHDAHIEIVGTLEQPVLFKNVSFAMDNGGGFHARQAVFDNCVMKKGGGFFGYFSSRWRLINCVLYKCTWPSLRGVDIGIMFYSSVFADMSFPDIKHDKDTLGHLRHENNIIGGCAFVDCQVSPTVFLCGECCSYFGCKFKPGEAPTGNAALAVEAFIFQCSGKTPDDAAGAPYMILQPAKPYPSPGIPTAALSPEILPKVRIVLDAGKPYKWISQNAAYTASSQFHEQQPSVALLDGSGGCAWEKTHSFHTDNEESPFIVIDLGDKQKVAALEIGPRSQYLKRTKTLAVWEGDSPEGPWSEVWANNNDERTYWILTFDKPQLCRYVKLGLKEKDYFHLNTVRVFSK